MIEAARNWLRPFLRADGSLIVEAAKIARLVATWETALAGVRRQIRVSRHLGA